MMATATLLQIAVAAVEATAAARLSNMIKAIVAAVVVTTTVAVTVAVAVVAERVIVMFQLL